MTPVEKSAEAIRLLEEAILEILQNESPNGVGPADMSRSLQIYRGGGEGPSGPRLNDSIVIAVMDKLEEEGKVINDGAGSRGRRGRRYIR